MRLVATFEDGEALFAAVCERGLEGAVAKRDRDPYRPGRSWATLQRRRGVALEDIADVLAHASTDTTRKHDAFPPSEAKRKTVRNFSLS